MSARFKSGNFSHPVVCRRGNQAQLFLAPSLPLPVASAVASEPPSQDPLNRNPCSFFLTEIIIPIVICLLSSPLHPCSRRWTEIIIHFKNLCMIEALKQHERFRVGRSVEQSGIRLGRAGEGRCCHPSSVQRVFRG